MAEQDRKAQLEEIQSIEAIYSDLIYMESPSQLSLRFSEDVQLNVSLPKCYPSRSPPYFELSGPSLKEAEKLKIINSLNEIYAKNIGQPILYEWISYLSNYLVDYDRDFDEKLNKEDEAASVSPTASSTSQLPLPKIISGDSFVDRKSTFQAHVAQVYSKKEVVMVLNKLKENNKIARATHNMYAWLTEENVKGRLIKQHDCEDDGETGAGAKLLNLLELMKAKNVLVIITRWYGGIHLGPDRFRHICNLARQILVDNGFSGHSS
ncbi:unnamed protein product [Thelazia callipaeda]|uniref:RWD domain-containing protein n=1 Tax=Thelazia callipaeda TaxID=103827 RepID=A0A0N5CNC1_THECL|nr:unnamed protein product [Thelazia callipaeda]